MTVTTLINHSYLAATILLSVISQIIIRWQVGLAGPISENLSGKILAMLHLLLTPWVILAMICTFASGVAWMLVLTKFELSYAYPFTCLQFVIVLGVGCLFFGEIVTWTKIVGTLVTIVGLIIIAKG